MFGFYKDNIDYLTEHAVDPDKRRYAVRNEFARHYIDIDHWDSFPFDSVPRNYAAAVMKYGKLYGITGEDTISIQLVEDSIAVFYKNHIYDFRYDEEIELNGDNVFNYFTDDHRGIEGKPVFVNQLVSFGILPYFLENFQNRLIRAFKSGNTEAILRLSADIGHYIADAHVPLHTTVNYNGQLTGQKGLHAFWESRLPELYADSLYDFLVGRSEYIEDYREKIWHIVLNSHSHLELVLKADSILRQELPEDQQYCFDTRLNSIVRTECRSYAYAYHMALDGMVEKQMQQAIHAVGSFWYSAWVDAGQPVLSSKFDAPDTISESEDQNSLNNAYYSGKIFGRQHNVNE